MLLTFLHMIVGLMFYTKGPERVRCLARFFGDGPRGLFFDTYILFKYQNVDF